MFLMIKAEGIASLDNLIAETAFANYLLNFDASELFNRVLYPG